MHRNHLDSTGKGACACARHGAFVPHSVVDFQKGERLVYDAKTIILLLMMQKANKHGLLNLPGSTAVSGARTSADHLRYMLSVEYSFPTAFFRVGLLEPLGFLEDYVCRGEMAPRRTHSGMLSEIYTQFC
jgi:hypothetical protein